MATGTIVIKIGSSSLTDGNGALSTERLRGHVEAICELRHQGINVIVVTSGAVAAGFTLIGYHQRPKSISQKQAAAAVGQSLLMQAYMDAFRLHGYTAAQLLLTRADFADPARFSNISQTLRELLKRGAIPVINENDSTSVDELTFGDNDRLSALVSGIIHADMLCLYTDVNGVYDQNPNDSPNAKKYHYLASVPEALLDRVSAATSAVGTGGMKSKLLAAKTAIELGTNVFIGNGKGRETFTDVLLGKGDGTYLGPFTNKTMSTTKQWIVFHSEPAGSIEIDSGASTALLKRGKSLLPAGVLSAKGDFSAGDIIEVFFNNRPIGKGKTNFSKHELELIKGLNSEEALSLTKRSKKAVIHRDFWVATKKECSY